MEEAVEGLLETLPMKLGELSQSRLAMLRSMLTHPEAAVSARRALGGSRSTGSRRPCRARTRGCVRR
ncbi:hypothetical protein GCM10020001_056870 [Nonomuraea salmonea]